MWYDLKTTITEFWDEHKIGGTFIGIVLLLIVLSQLFELIKWIF